MNIPKFKLKQLVTIFVISIFISSCVTKKDVVYFQNAKNFETIVDTDTFTVKFKVGDIMNIVVSTLDPLAAAPYNPVSPGGMAQAIDYLIDVEGNIDFPVLGKTIETSIRQVGNSINPNNRAFRIEVGVPNQGGDIKPNLTSKLKINDYTNPKAILIPQSIISENSTGEQYVFVVDSIESLHRILIKSPRWKIKRYWFALFPLNIIFHPLYGSQSVGIKISKNTCPAFCTG